jgi:hypothetical protein
MAGTINDFKSSFNNDIARSNRFDVNIPVPVTLAPIMNKAKNLQYRCESANLPGRSLMTTEQRTYGPVEKYPYLTAYTDIDLTFLVSGDMDEKLFFDLWLDYINPMFNYNIEYKSDYSTVITINQYNLQNELTYSVNLFDAFPVSVNQMDLNWGNDGVHKLTVTFAYTYWQNNDLEAIALQLAGGAVSGIANALGGLGGNALGSLNSAFNSVPNALQNIIYK